MPLLNVFVEQSNDFVEQLLTQVVRFRDTVRLDPCRVAPLGDET
jgi:hypothetical protein